MHWVALDFMGTYMLKRLRQVKMLKAQNYSHEHMIRKIRKIILSEINKFKRMLTYSRSFY